MKFSSLTERTAGESVDAWDTHYEGLARLAAGEEIIVLSVGQETHENTPAPIVDAAIESLKGGRHHYTAVEGLPELRKAIARRHRELTGQNVDESNCAVFAGAQNALFAAAQCILEHGDEVILIEPYYTTYPASVSASGAEIVSVATRPENQFQIEPDDIISAITPRTRAILINSPNNPTGAVYTRKQFEPLVQACVQNDIWLINDEVYQEILLPGDRASPASIPGADQVCITISSLSKSHRMTGWRLGWIVGPGILMPHLYNLSMCMAYGLPEFIMDAAVKAFEYGNIAAQQVRVNMDRRRKIINDELDGLDGLDIYSSVGGMYVVLDVRGLEISSRQFARRMLDDYNVSVLPCDGFGQSGKGLIRVSLCAEDEQMKVACDRIAEFVRAFTRIAKTSAG
jgi:arginine:pyruvate transaminase